MSNDEKNLAAILEDLTKRALKAFGRTERVPGIRRGCRFFIIQVNSGLLIASYQRGRIKVTYCGDPVLRHRRKIVDKEAARTVIGILRKRLILEELSRIPDNEINDQHQQNDQV